MDKGLTEVRCVKCGSLLAKTDGRIEIKCRKCKTLNKFEAQEALARNGQGDGDNNSLR